MEDIVNGTYQDSSKFKSLNLKAKGKEIKIGSLHPLMKMRTRFRETLLEMGF